MNFRQLATIVLGWGVLSLPAPASTRHMPIEEVQPGMTGVGRTVFKGSAVEEFRADILGVVRSNVGPQRDLIIATLSGGPLARTGVIAGMSGSPVYIDGRLVGAVSYALGSFATEPIAGITPIGEMVEATTRAASAPGPRIAPIPIGADFSVLVSAVADTLRPGRAFVPLAWPAGAHAVPLSLGDAGALRPIALPLSVGGLTGPATARALSTFEGAGFALAPAGAARAPQAAPATAEPLRPGDAVGVALITGDLQFGATGTVTDVDGTRVLAFGHPLYNVGPASFAMTRAYVHTVLPSLNSSMKLASLGEVVGAMQQDRSTAVAGAFGARPRTIGMTVSLTRDGAPRRRFEFSLADHPLLTPLLAYTALVGIVSEHERDIGPATYALRGRAVIAGHAAVEFDDVYAGDQPGIAMASAVAMPLGALLTSGLAAVRIESLSLDIEGAERIRSATIDRVWLDTTDVRPGKAVPVKILLTPWRGEQVVRTLSVDIPQNAGGPLTLVVADGVRFAQWEQREQRATLKPASVDQMVKALNASRRGHRIYVRLVGRDTGAVVNGEVMPSLPSSVLSVMQGDRGAAANPPLQSSVLGAWEIPMDHAVEGLRTLTLPLSSRRP
ncbi:MAG: SpoIVB peptidase S55 domain-containing protein [Vicinamibacterales bacterium]